MVREQTLTCHSSINLKSPIIFRKASCIGEAQAILSTPWINLRSPIIFGGVSSIAGRFTFFQAAKAVTILNIGKSCIKTSSSFLCDKDRHAVNQTCKTWKRCLESLSEIEKQEIARVLDSIADGLPVSFEKQKREISLLMELDVYKSSMRPCRSLVKKRELIYTHALSILGFKSYENIGIGPYPDCLRSVLSRELRFDPRDPSLKDLLKNLLINPGIGMFIVQKYDKLVDYLSAEDLLKIVLTNPDLGIFIVRKYPYFLRTLPKEHSRYEEIALEAIKVEGDVIQYIKRDHPKYEIILSRAIEIKPNLIEVILRCKLIDNPEELILKACKLDPRCIENIPETHPKYKDFAREAVKNNPGAILMVDNSMPGYWELAVEAVNKRPTIIHYIRPNISDTDYWKLFIETYKKNPQIADDLQGTAISLFQRILKEHLDKSSLPKIAQ